MASHYRFLAVQVLTVLCALTLGVNVCAFEPDTHSALSILAARNHYLSRVGEFVSGQLREPNGLRTLGYVYDDPYAERPLHLISYSYLDALGLGAMDEDSEYKDDLHFAIEDKIARHRMANHFYDPTRNGMGLNDFPGFLEYLSDQHVILPPNPQTDSLHWAWDNRGAVTTKRGDEKYGWAQAREHYLLWLVHHDAALRSWHAGETFYALGHVIHLIQDLAQPQHTRNDGHMPHVDDAPFEEYCLNHYGTPGQIASLPFEAVPEFGVLPAQRPDGIPPEFRAFWNTDQLFFNRSDSPTYSSALGLAEFSNFFFVTDDTMFTGEPESQMLWDATRGILNIRSPFDFKQEHAFRWPRLSAIDVGRALPPNTGQFSVLRGGETAASGGILTGLRRVQPPLMEDFCEAEFILGTSQKPPSLALVLTDAAREAHARILLPKAIAYSTGLLNYFFRGRLKMDFIYPVVGTSGNPQIAITNLTEKESLGPGEFTLLQEDPTTSNRTVSVVTTLSINNSYRTNLAPSQGFTANLGSDIARDGNLILVFKGAIGNEKDIAVAAVVSPGLCGNFELLANRGTNTVVEAGELITFQRSLLNTNGTSTDVPLTVNSWGGGFGNWTGSPIDGISETGHHESYAFMNWGDGSLRAQRRGTWTLRPNGGGCVTVVVKSDLVHFGANEVECSIDGVSFGVLSYKGNDLARRLFPGIPDSCAFRTRLEPGVRHVVVRNNSKPNSPQDSGARYVWWTIYGGASPLGGSTNLLKGQTQVFDFTVPEVPGDPPPPTDPPVIP